MCIGHPTLWFRSDPILGQHHAVRARTCVAGCLSSYLDFYVAFLRASLEDDADARCFSHDGCVLIAVPAADIGGEAFISNH